MYRITVAALYLFVSILCLQGQDQPTIRVSTRLVQVNVLVHKKGAPVADLKKEDFTLFDRGKERQIAVFSADSANTKPDWPVLPPNVFSNRILPPGTSPTITVILFDVLNTKITNQISAKYQIVKFLSQLRPEDRVAIYILARQVRILHDFTSEPSHLIEALARYRGRHASELSASEPEKSAPSARDDLDAFLENSEQVSADFYNVDRVLLTLSGMEAIAHHLAALPGRKNLIWVSSSFPFTLGLTPETFFQPGVVHRTFEDEARRATRVMNDSNVAIYPVDARGLDFPMADASANMRPTIGMPLRAPAPNHDTMDILADHTGGRAYYNTNDLGKAIRSAIDDAQLTYTLGFYPPDEDWDEKFHDIKVKVNRGGVDVRYRKGFVAMAQRAPDPKTVHELLEKTLSTAVEATGIGLDARTEIVDKPKPGTVFVSLRINPENLTLEQSKDRWVGAVDLLIAQRTAEGKVLEATNHTLDLNLTKERYTKIMERSLEVRKSVLPLDKAEQIRIVVLDHGTGNVGSLQIPLRTKK